MTRTGGIHTESSSHVSAGCRTGLLLGLLLSVTLSSAAESRFSAVKADPVPLPTPAQITTPALTATPAGPILSWLEPRGSDGHSLRYSILDDDGWSEPQTVIDDDPFWISWADPPWLTAFADGTLVAHWPKRSGKNWYDYQMHMALKPPGEPWGAPFLLHADAGPGQHGLASGVRQAPGLLHYLWLDERSGTMALRSRTMGADGSLGVDGSVDEQTCSCCRIALAVLPDGDLLAAYRDRTSREIRDFRIRRHSAQAGWRDTG